MSYLSSPTTDSSLVAILMKIEERMGRMEERMSLRFDRMEDRISNLENSRASNSHTPERNQTLSEDEPLTPFIRSHLASVPREVGRRQTILQTDEDGVEYAVRAGGL